MGRPKKIPTPEKMLEYYAEYKQDILDNPITVQKWVGKDAKEVTEKHFKPPTWSGFEAYLFKCGIIENLDWYRRNQNGYYEEYQHIIRAIQRDMFDRKFSGAAVGVFQHNIIARELGLAEQQVNTNIERPILEGGKELPKDFDGVTDADLLGGE